MKKYNFMIISALLFLTKNLLANEPSSIEIDLNPQKYLENKESLKETELQSNTQRKKLLKIDGVKYYVVGNPNTGELLIPKLDKISSEDIDYAKCANPLHTYSYSFDENGEKTRIVKSEYKGSMVIGGRIPLNDSLSIFSKLIVSNIKSRCNAGNTSYERTRNQPDPNIDIGISKKWGGRRPKKAKAFIRDFKSIGLGLDF